MTVSPEIPMYFAEFSFGMIYAILIHWLAGNKYLQGYTAVSVIVGDTATILIAYGFMRSAIPMHILFIVFACSGTPMTLSYFYRYEQRKANHKARTLGYKAARIRDEALIDLELLARDEQDPKLVHLAHKIKDNLKGM